ncbi:MAG: hypothetical protein ABS87_04640 [Sphingomonas sp. SCN 67-18]|nr:MAG: hypothetical protein ABS87_04640 [Sphingomonas sp. SCN 67-18]
MVQPNGSTTGVGSTATDFSGGVSLSYDPATGGYTVRDASSSRTFLASSRNSTLSNTTVSVYDQSTGTRSDQLVLFNPGAANPRLALTYVSYGAWQILNDRGTAADFTQQFFVYGIRQAADQVSTGSASYTTRPDGFWTTASGIYSLSGTSRFTANFTSMTVATSLNLSGTNVINSSTKTLGLFNGTGTIAALGGGFSGNFTQVGTDSDGAVYSGAFNGAFFGPTGSEMGYTFRLTSGSGAAVGAVVGKATTP